MEEWIYVVIILGIVMLIGMLLIIKELVKRNNIKVSGPIVQPATGSIYGFNPDIFMKCINYCKATGKNPVPCYNSPCAYDTDPICVLNQYII